MSQEVLTVEWLGSHLMEALNRLEAAGSPIVLSRGGEPRYVLQDLDAYNEMCQSLAMLRIIAVGNSEVESGKVLSLEQLETVTKQWE